MSVDFHATGAEDLRALSLELKAAGEKELRSELFRGLNRATKPLRADAKARALATLPSSGGLAGRVANCVISTKNRVGADPGVRLVARAGKSRKAGPVDVSQVDAGYVRHPTFGHRPSVVQQVTPGWFTGAIQGDAGKVRDELLEAIDVVLRKLRS